MCTASWLRAGERFHFFFNRDELRTRPRALAPRLRGESGRRWLAPVDAAAGGTWIAANERGLVLALLNRSEEGRSPGSGPRSRGGLIPALAGAADAGEAERLFDALPLGGVAPFRLFFRDASGAPPFVRGWNGRASDRETLDPAAGLLASSSLGDDRVTVARRAIWEPLRAAPEFGPVSLRAFHRSHAPERSALSVCMHRDDARTVSHVEIRLDAHRLEMRYVDGPPGETAEAILSALERSA